MSLKPGVVIYLHKVSFDEGVAHLSVGHKIVVGPKYIRRLQYMPGQEPRSYIPKLTFFDDGSVMALVSDWEYGYYGDIEPKDPLFYLGKVEKD